MSKIVLRLQSSTNNTEIHSHIRVSEQQNTLFYRSLGVDSESSFTFDRIYSAEVTDEFFIDEEINAMVGAVNVFIGSESANRYKEFVQSVNCYIKQLNDLQGFDEADVLSVTVSDAAPLQDS